MAITITINGEKKEISANLSVSALLLSLDIDSRKVAIEKNQHLVRRINFDETPVNNGDAVEIINFVGGG